MKSDKVVAHPTRELDQLRALKRKMQSVGCLAYPSQGNPGDMILAVEVTLPSGEGYHLTLGSDHNPGIWIQAEGGPDDGPTYANYGVDDDLIYWTERDPKWHQGDREYWYNWWQLALTSSDVTWVPDNKTYRKGR